MARTWSVVAPGLLVATLVSCGSSADGAASCTPSPTLPPLPPAVFSSGPVSVAADHSSVEPGGTVSFTVTVAGPVQFTAACLAPVQLIVSDQAGLHVFAASPPAPRGAPCDTVKVAAGQKVEYTLSWPTDVHLPSGSYLATFTLDDQPAVSAQVTVGSTSTEGGLPPMTCRPG